MATTKKTTSPKTTTRAKTTRAPAGTARAKPAEAKSAAPDEVAVPVEFGGTEAAEARSMTKKDLLARVRKASGAKGGDVRQVIDAVLEELGAALARGESLKLPPLGNVRVQRFKPGLGGDMLVLKLKRRKAAPEGNDPLAEAAE